jgi:hypothetical protein
MELVTLVKLLPKTKPNGFDPSHLHVGRRTSETSPFPAALKAPWTKTG